MDLSWSIATKWHKNEPENAKNEPKTNPGLTIENPRKRETNPRTNPRWKWEWSEILGFGTRIGRNWRVGWKRSGLD